MPVNLPHIESDTFKYKSLTAAAYLDLPCPKYGSTHSPMEAWDVFHDLKISHGESAFKIMTHTSENSLRNALSSAISVSSAHFIVGEELDSKVCNMLSEDAKKNCRFSEKA